MSPVNSNDDAVRERAREALAGPGRLARASVVRQTPATDPLADLSPTEQAKRQAAAQAAMEGYDRRERRKALEAQQAAAEATRKKLAADLAAQRQAERDAEQARKRLEQEQLAVAEAEKQRHRQKIAEAEKTIEALKREPTVSLKPLRTYQTDLGERLPENASPNLGSKILRDQRAYAQSTKLILSRQWLFAAGAGLLILLGAGLIAGSWYWFNPSVVRTPRADNAIKVRMILPVEDQRELVLAERNQFELRDQMYDLKTTIARNYAAAPSGGRLLNLYPTGPADETGRRQQVGLEVFLTAFKIELPAVWQLAVSDTFMVGLYQAKRPAFFYLFKVNAYEPAAAALLVEGGRITDALFSPLANDVAMSRALRDLPFKDEVVDNVDVRLIRELDGQVVMVYAFLDEQTLVMTESLEAFERILSLYRTPLPVSR